MDSHNNSILAIIPARGGSKGIIRKNLRPLCGRPLIAYTVQASLACKSITRTIVSTDDTEIADTARSYGADVPFMRPPELASDSTLTIDVVIHALNMLESDGKSFDIVVLLQPTAPLRKPEDIDNALRMLHHTGADSVISFVKVEREHPYYMFKLDGDRPKQLLEIPPQLTHAPRQQFPPVYYRNGAIYATKRDVLIRDRNFYGKDTRAYIMPPGRSVNIDEEMDLTIAEYLLRRMETTKNDYDQDSEHRAI